MLAGGEPRARLTRAATAALATNVGEEEDGEHEKKDGKEKK
jgi:hypothetical protein